MVRRRLEWLLCWCALVAAVGYVHGHLLVDRSAKQRVQALLAHQNPISALRTSAPVSPLGVTRNGPAPAASSGSATSSRSGDGRSGGRSSSSSYADTVRLLYSARDAREARIREPRVTPVLSQELEDVRSANEHFLRIRTTARCRVPRTRVVHVKEFYSDPSKEYLPRCTILHRCGDDAGCCDSEQYQCVPRAVQEVTLHFYTIHLQNQNAGEVGLRNSVTKLLFPNHTECECQPVNDIPRTAARPSRIAHHSGEHNKVSLHAPSSEDPDMAAGSGMHEELPSGPLKCHNCPEPFSRRLYEDGRCSCDCFEKQKRCLKIKRGREPLGDLARRCVETQDCHVPECEYGLYDVDSGRCPKRPDYWPKHVADRKVHPHSHRWQFFERD